MSEATKKEQAQYISEDPALASQMLRDALCLLGRIHRGPDDTWNEHRSQLRNGIAGLLDIREDFECEWCQPSDTQG